MNSIHVKIWTDLTLYGLYNAYHLGRKALSYACIDLVKE